mmetsp:Transcript_22045/g.63592  ORF Transcript_22045/g.63592 Transcript_22045/m.63592 type:complete len:210 (+) Transcript_22045:826-1455(+)
MVVKEAMSEKRIVTSRSCSSMLGSSASLRSSSWTTGQGTYLPQDLMAFFMFSKVSLMSLTSHVPCARPGSSELETPASCSLVMLSISSASSTRGLSRFRERYVRSRVSRPMPERMMTMAATVVSIAMRASASTAPRPSSTATEDVRRWRSSGLRSSSERSGTLMNTRSTSRNDEALTSLSMSARDARSAHRSAEVLGKRHGLAGANSLQ